MTRGAPPSQIPAKPRKGRTGGPSGAGFCFWARRHSRCRAAADLPRFAISTQKAAHRKPGYAAFLGRGRPSTAVSKSLPKACKGASANPAGRLPGLTLPGFNTIRTLCVFGPSSYTIIFSISVRISVRSCSGGRPSRRILPHTRQSWSTVAAVPSVSRSRSAASASSPVRCFCKSLIRWIVSGPSRPFSMASYRRSIFFWIRAACFCRSSALSAGLSPCRILSSTA